jgi:DHA1 family tetracycline resistance protein-like MFS transporter
MANFALYTRYRLGLNDQTTSYVMTYAGILLILVQVAGIGWVTKRFSEKQILFGGLAVITVALLGLAIVPDLVQLLVVILPLALAGGLLNTIINSMISKSVNPEEVGGALGLATSAESLTWVIAPTVGGFLIDHLGGGSLGLIGGAITGLLLTYTWRQRVTKRRIPGSPRPTKEGDQITGTLNRSEGKKI